MTKICVMATCPDCIQIKEQAKYAPNYQLIDIGEHVKNLKEFLRLRDSHPAFYWGIIIPDLSVDINQQQS